MYVLGVFADLTTSFLAGYLDDIYRLVGGWFVRVARRSSNIVILVSSRLELGVSN